MSMNTLFYCLYYWLWGFIKNIIHNKQISLCANHVNISGIFIVNFEHVSFLSLDLLLLTLNIYLFAG